MNKNHEKLLNLLERRISLLVEQNAQYARFKNDIPFTRIREILSHSRTSREDIIDLGILLHLQALQLRLSMYEQFTPFTWLHFENDLTDLINTLHSYERQNRFSKDSLSSCIEDKELQELIPPCATAEIQVRPLDNTFLYNEICTLLGKGSTTVPVTIPQDVVSQMQDIDKKRIYSELPVLIKKKKSSTLRQLQEHLPVFENQRLALAAIFSEVLFLANAGQVRLSQMTDDIEVECV